MNNKNRYRSFKEPDKTSEIVDQLKKQGLFDKFRKDCLADVDTKPAYLNLKTRVDGFVNRFLSMQKWSPTLNKNQLRERLRKQLSDSNLLSSGIKRIVEQVLNPKINRDFKPKVDKAICAILGVDSEERQEKLKKRDEWKRKQEQHHEDYTEYQDPHQHYYTHEAMLMGGGGVDPSSIEGGMGDYVPSLLDIQLAQGTSREGGAGGHGSMLPSGMLDMPPGVQGNNLMPLPPGVNPADAMNQFGSYLHGGAPQPPPPSAPPPPDGKEKGANVKTEAPDMTYGVPGLEEPPPLPHQQIKEEKEDEEGESEMMEVEETVIDSELMNIPIPDSDGTTATVAGEHHEQQDQEGREEQSEAHDMVEQDSSVVVYEQVEYGNGVNSNEMKVECADGASMDRTADSAQNVIIPEGDSQSNEKSYHFAWEDLDEDALSNVSVSSVHTSDLSSYDISDVDELASDEGESHSHDSIPPQQACASSPSEETRESSPPRSKESKSPNSCETSELDTPLQHDQTSIEDKEKPETDDSAPPVKQKTRRLVALTYNYSDSEDEETREERKARIAKEKEERYLRRQQRRAELEAKLKEKLEERQRFKDQKKEQANVKVEENIEDNEQNKEENIEEEKAYPSDDEEPEDDKSIVKKDDPDWEPHGDFAEETEPSVKKEKREKAAPAKKRSGSTTTKKKMASPKKSQRTKEALKEQLREQKVMEKRMALRRQRTRNRKYFSDEFTSIYTEKKHMFSNEAGYGEELSVPAMEVETETVVLTEEVVTDQQQQQQDMEVHSGTDSRSNIGRTRPTGSSSSRHHTRRTSTDNTSRSDTPYSDISEHSKSSSVEFIKETKLSPSQLVGFSEGRDPDKEAARMKERYGKNDVYKHRSSRRRRRKHSHDGDDAEVSGEDGDDGNDDDERSSLQSDDRSWSRSRSDSRDGSHSRSQGRNRSKLRSLSRSRSHSRSYTSYTQSSSRSSRSRSWSKSSRSDSYSRSRSRSPLSRSVSPHSSQGPFKESLKDSDHGSPSVSSDSDRHKRPLRRDDFGEAARRHLPCAGNEVNYGEATSQHWSSSFAKQATGNRFSGRTHGQSRGGNNRGNFTFSRNSSFQQGGVGSYSGNKRGHYKGDRAFPGRQGGGTSNKWTRQQSQTMRGGDIPEQRSNREWPDIDDRKGNVRYEKYQEPGEIEEVGSPISSDSDLGVGDTYDTSSNLTPPTRENPMRFTDTISPISDDEFQCLDDSPSASQHSSSSSHFIGGSSGPSTTIRHHSSDYTRSTTYKSSTHYISPAAKAAAELYKSDSKTKNTRKRSEEDLRATKRVRRH